MVTRDKREAQARAYEIIEKAYDLTDWESVGPIGGLMEATIKGLVKLAIDNADIVGAKAITKELREIERTIELIEGTYGLKGYSEVIEPIRDIKRLPFYPEEREELVGFKYKARVYHINGDIPERKAEGLVMADRKSLADQVEKIERHALNGEDRPIGVIVELEELVELEEGE